MLKAPPCCYVPEKILWNISFWWQKKIFSSFKHVHTSDDVCASFCPRRDPSYRIVVVVLCLFVPPCFMLARISIRIEETDTFLVRNTNQLIIHIHVIKGRLDALIRKGWIDWRVGEGGGNGWIIRHLGGICSLTGSNEFKCAWVVPANPREVTWSK